MTHRWYLAVALALAVSGVGVLAQGGKTKTMSAQGKVTAIASDSLSIAKGSETMKFSVDASTKVVAKGAGTKAREKGGTISITDAVHENDMVTVKYHDMGGGNLHAAEVRVTSQAPAKK